ncbi:hypothetical protein [Enterococcus sp. LJL51]|uniref:hypothetical protein n=1 Tax=Enterococcus sp. LJL51 TaxID=3416656 RepID=UPI003CF012EB
MSKSYQIFLEEHISKEKMDSIVNHLEGYETSNGHYTIQDGEATIWVNYAEFDSDLDYYASENAEILSEYQLKINYILDVEVGSDEQSEVLVQKFYSGLKKEYPKSVIMNQDGKFFEKL